ncbi:MAG: hypothetical protein M3022_12855 [Actinomycetota bacterium]|nr:hypothetical protein [Actinomycetota bacterium]
MALEEMRTGRPLTEANRRTLAFAAEHRLIVAAHVAVLLGTSRQAADRRLRRLVASGHLRADHPLRTGRWYQIERRGLGAIGSRLPRPQAADTAGSDHDIGLGWLWLAAQRGAFGPTRAVHSERQMRSEDGRPRSAAIGPERHAVRLAGVGPHGGDRRHYPDLVLETDTGHRVAIELELTGKGRRRTEEILGGYAFDHRVDAVLYLVTHAETGDAIERAASAAGIANMVHVQRVAFGPGSSARRAPTAQRAAGKAPGRRELTRARAQPAARPRGQTRSLSR